MDEQAVKELQAICEQILATVKPIVEAPSPEGGKFTFLLNTIFRKAAMTYSAVCHLGSNPEHFGDSSLALVRKIVEDVITVKYMIAIGKELQAERLERFMWMQLRQILEDRRKRKIDPEKIGLFSKAEIELIDQKYEEVKDEFMHKTTNKDLHNWAELNIEKQLELLFDKDKIKESEFNNYALMYTEGNWKSHLNPYDVVGYNNVSLHTLSSLEAHAKALSFGAVALFELSYWYNKEIEEVTGKLSSKKI
jgi:Family of unknown function (DUF5677)